MQTLTKKTLKSLLLEANHALVVEDFDDIEELDRLADKFAGVSAQERRLLNTPFELCGLKFYPLTVAKSLWFNERLDEWEISPSIKDAFFFWLLTVPNTAEALDEFSTFKKAEKDMRKRVLRKLNCTNDELGDICAKCCGRYEKSDGNSDETTANRYGGLLACLIREYGQSLNYWLYDATVDQVSEMYEQFVTKMIAQDESSRKTASSGGKARAPQLTPRLQAYSDFMQKTRELKLKWSAENGE